MAQVSSKHSYLTLLINAAGLLHVPNILSPGMDVADPAPQQAAMVTSNACVCRDCSVKAGKQQLAEGFCSEHIWTHSGFKGKPVQHLTMIKCSRTVHTASLRVSHAGFYATAVKGSKRWIPSKVAPINTVRIMAVLVTCWPV